MIVIMDMASGEWTIERGAEDDSLAAAPPTPDHGVQPRLALREVSTEARYGRRSRCDFPPAMALLQLLARQ